MKYRARSLRKNITIAENRLWYYLRNRRLNGYKFIRQYIIGCYIVDFVCRDIKLVVEIDGGQHSTATGYDQSRTDFLMQQGYSVIRFLE